MTSSRISRRHLLQGSAATALAATLPGRTALAADTDAAVLTELDGQRTRWLARGRALLDQRLAGLALETKPAPAEASAGEGGEGGHG